MSFVHLHTLSISVHLLWVWNQDPVEVVSLSNKQKPMSPVTNDGDEFNSFLFWREPLPTLDDDLLELLVSLGGDWKCHFLFEIWTFIGTNLTCKDQFEFKI